MTTKCLYCIFICLQYPWKMPLFPPMLQQITLAVTQLSACPFALGSPWDLLLTQPGAEHPFACSTKQQV